jgi:hypothetical protein
LVFLLSPLLLLPVERVQIVAEYRSQETSHSKRTPSRWEADLVFETLNKCRLVHRR